MYYKSLNLENFRSYKSYAAEFSDGVNIVVGPNASGKTNLLEAVLFLSRGKSYRVKDVDLINFDSDWFSLSSTLEEDHSRAIKVSHSNERLEKFYEIDEVKLKRLSINKKIPVVLFEPDNLRLITGSPDRRRNYVDEILEQTVPGYATTLRDYRRALSQRNRLLKQNKKSYDTLFVWNIKLAEYGAKIVEARQNLVERINEIATKTYSSLGPSDSVVEVNYQSNINVKDYSNNLLNKLEKSLQTDLERGFTSHGPHRDDLTINLNNSLATTSASRGETRTLVLMLKILELHLQEEFYDTKPIFLLDDVFSELDSRRRRALTEYLEGYQSIITTTDADAILDGFSDYSVLPLTRD